MRKYICTIESDSTNTRTYTVTTSSAIKAAAIYGRAENGEEITITSTAGKILSRAIWSAEKRDYTRVTI